MPRRSSTPTTLRWNFRKRRVGTSRSSPRSTGARSRLWSRTRTRRTSARGKGCSRPTKSDRLLGSGLRPAEASQRVPKARQSACWRRRRPTAKRGAGCGAILAFRHVRRRPPHARPPATASIPRFLREPATRARPIRSRARAEFAKPRDRRLRR